MDVQDLHLFYPFDSIQDQYGVDDRAYLAEDVAQYHAALMTNGVHPNPGDSLFVSAAGGWGIALQPGYCVIEGRIGRIKTQIPLAADPADGTRPRIDRVVIRVDYRERKLSALIKKGVAATNPTAPVLQRDADAYEIGLADIALAAGASAITQSMITDTRQNSALCGIVNSLIKVDADTLFAQYEAVWDEWITRHRDLVTTQYSAFELLVAGKTNEALALFAAYAATLEENESTYLNALRTFFETFKGDANDEFYGWLATLQATLDENVAANLLSLITDLTNRVALAEAVLFNDIIANPFLVQFENLSGVEVAGIWNAALGRVEC